MTRLKVDQAALGRLLNSEEVGEGMVQIAQPVLDQAISTAPVVSGEYRDSLRVEVFHDEGVAGARVIADSDHAIYVEADHGTLSRALDAAGLAQP